MALSNSISVDIPNKHGVEAGIKLEKMVNIEVEMQLLLIKAFLTNSFLPAKKR